MSQLMSAVETCMDSYLVELKVLFLFLAFIYFHTLCVGIVKAMVNL